MSSYIFPIEICNRISMEAGNGKRSCILNPVNDSTRTELVYNFTSDHPFFSRDNILRTVRAL